MSKDVYSGLPLVLLGAGGHARVLQTLVSAIGCNIVGVCDPLLSRNGISHWRGLQVLGDDDALGVFDPASIGLVNGVGQLVGSRVRQNLYTKMRHKGFVFPALAHPTAWISPDVELRDGVQVMAGACIQTGCTIGQNTIVNTGANVDHDCFLGAHVHVAPGSTICGNVCLDDGVFIGAGSVVIQGLRVGLDSVIGAGATLTRDLGSGLRVIGSPNRP